MGTLNDGITDDQEEITESFSFEDDGKRYEIIAKGRKLPLDTGFRCSVSVNKTFLEDAEINATTAPTSDNYIWEGGKEIPSTAIEKLGKEIEKRFS